MFVHSVVSQFEMSDLEWMNYDNADDKELILVIEVTRHGARSPTGGKDYWYNNTWDIGSGQLTPVGERMQYLQGKRLRRMYIEQAKFLPDKYDPRNFYVRSTDYNRTIASALAQMQGLYSLNSGKVFTKSEERQRALPPYPITSTATEIINVNDVLPGRYNPFPVHVQLKKYEHLLRGYDPSVWQMMGKLTKESVEAAGEKHKEELQPMYDELYQKFKVPNASLTFEKIEDYVDSYVMSKVDGRNFTNDLSPLSQNLTIKYLRLLYYEGTYGTSEAIKLTASTFMSFLNSTIKQKVAAYNGDKNATDFIKNIKLIILSAHDTTLAGFISAIGQGPNQTLLPPLASMILIEVYKKNSAYYISWRFNGEYMNITNDWKTQDKVEL